MTRKALVCIKPQKAKRTTLLTRVVAGELQGWENVTYKMVDSVGATEWQAGCEKRVLVRSGPC